jgi:diadenosine tetraphosphate (Ap4A) HIT family hydrolase
MDRRAFLSLKNVSMQAANKLLFAAQKQAEEEKTAAREAAVSALINQESAVSVVQPSTHVAHVAPETELKKPKVDETKAEAVLEDEDASPW